MVPVPFFGREWPKSEALGVCDEPCMEPCGAPPRVRGLGASRWASALSRSCRVSRSRAQLRLIFASLVRRLASARRLVVCRIPDLLVAL